MKVTTVEPYKEQLESADKVIDTLQKIIFRLIPALTDAHRKLGYLPKEGTESDVRANT